MVETEKLARSWGQYEADWLRDYLVAGVEDPRLNLQSIISRHFLLNVVAPGQFSDLMRQEYRFAAAMEWLLTSSELKDADVRNATLYALQRGADNAEGLEIPAFIVYTFGNLPAKTQEWVVPNYLEMYLSGPMAEYAASRKQESTLDTFALAWQSVLTKHFPAMVANSTAGEDNDNAPTEATRENATPQRLPTLLEPACGSANDYRFLERYGLARLFDYTGFDLCQKNVDNARQLFPRVFFQTGNVFEIQAPPKSFDFCIVHDLFEHFSLAGLEQAVGEVCRVTRQGLCLGFFQMDEIADHIVRPRDDYYWNLLSLTRLKGLFASHGFGAQAINLGSFLAHHTGCQYIHNPNAYAFIIRASAAAQTPTTDVTSFW